VGRGGKNKPEDVQAVQVALNRKIKAGLNVDGKCGPSTIKAIMDFQKALGKFRPDGLIEVGRGSARALASNAPLGPAPEPPSPVPPPKLGKGTLDGAPTAWRGMHGILTKNVGELKKAVRSEYANEHPTLLKDIDEALKKLDGVVEKIGTEISDHLAAANTAKDPAEKKAKLQACKALIASKIQYVKSEPMIAHMDRNPFGVAMNCQRMITDHLVHVAQAIGNVG
jgi:peptidoglycan hydrolase-like protein with peptidoglycan-binding domain